MTGHGLAKAALDVDARLSAISNGFDLLLHVTPTNAEEAWTEFEAGRYERIPDFEYRPLTFDPEDLKHELWAVRPESAEDPALVRLFRDMQSPRFAFSIVTVLYRGADLPKTDLSEGSCGNTHPCRKRR